MINGVDYYTFDEVRHARLGWALEDSIYWEMYFDTLRWIDNFEDEELREIYTNITFDEIVEEYLL